MLDTILKLAKVAGGIGFTVSELAKAAELTTDAVSSIINEQRYPSEDSKLPQVIKTVDIRNDEPVFCHISQMANYTFQRKARMMEENPDYGKYSTPIEDIVNDTVYEKAMEESTNAE